MSSSNPKLPLPGLKLPSSLITDHLAPDVLIPDLSSFREIQRTSPSIQRRARLLSPQSHYSYVSPFVVPFPYSIPRPEDAAPEDGGAYIEKWLAQREAIEEVPSDFHLKLNYPKDRDTARHLIGLSETCLQDCLPHLDTGDAFAVMGIPTLIESPQDEFEDTDALSEKRRIELIDVLSGYAVLMTPSEPSANPQFGPFSLRYSGHQFGNWAGQLGDGRAITIHVVQHPTLSDVSYELQLKGSGRTPFSRSADGLAVLRSSIREYLCSEAMVALGIPSTRSLSLVYLPDIPVAREKQETACVLTRVAESFIRIGCFEAFNPPAEMFFFGGGQQKADYEALRILGEWVSTHVLKTHREGSDEAWGEKLVKAVAERNAVMVAGWQAYGFMHGVINTDNVSILGLTIDYGPYAFMDKFDRSHICNHSDSEGRYSYKFQPSMIMFAVRALLQTLAPLIGREKELHNKCVPPGWANGASEEQIEKWKQTGLEFANEADRIVQETCSVEYGRLMRKRLGLTREETRDETKFFKPLLDILEDHELDFHLTFRTLSFFTPEILRNVELKENFIQRLLEPCAAPNRLDTARSTEDWTKWLTKYSERIESENRNIDDRQESMLQANPRFILRQWVLQDTIAKVEEDPLVGRRFLGKVMQMACNPFRGWGGEGLDEGALSDEQKAERRLCEMGARTMLGFQCSCSS